MKKIIIALLLLIVAACGVIAVRHAACRVPAKPTQSDPPALKEWENNSMADLPPGHEPHHHWEWAGDAERVQLESVWATAATNLLSGSIQGVKKCVATASERMKSVPPEQLHVIVRPYYDLLKSEFMAGVISRSYVTSLEFKSRVVTIIEGMNILGEIENVSAVIPRQCAFLEADALAMVRKCMLKFSEEGREDFVLAAKELEKRIIDQIESENGLTRRYMKADLKVQMLVYERGYSTRENVIRGVRTLAQYLENTTGYIPKWLDEDFPFPQDGDDRSDYGSDKTAEYRRTTDKLVARMYAAGAANKSGAAKRVAIIQQGSHPAPENLQYLYAFTNDMSYACLAAASIVQIVGVTSNSMAIADHALSMNPAQKNDGYRLCEIIVQKANEDVATPECRRIAVETVNKHAPKIPGAETLASRMAIEPSASPSPVALKPAVSPEIDIPKDKQIKAAFLTASAPRRCGTEGIGAFNRAVALCDGDNCLISRIATEIATEHTNRVPWAIGVLSKYGSKENVPFLLGFTNDVRYCERAAHALLCIDGVTEETIEIANRAVMRDPNDSGEKYAICSAISRLSSKDGEMSKRRRLAISTLKRYSRTIPVTSLWADEFLLELDPSYETSEERGEMLREVVSRRVNDWQVNYATNALKKIDVEKGTRCL